MASRRVLLKFHHAAQIDPRIDFDFTTLDSALRLNKTVHECSLDETASIHIYRNVVYDKIDGVQAERARESMDHACVHRAISVH